MPPLLIFHVCAGMVGLLSGTAAMSVRKGSRWHRLAGNAFVVSMLCMGTAGAALAFAKSQMHNVFGGMLTVYLVTTAWVTAKRRDGEAGVFERVALVAALGTGSVIIAFGLEAARSPTGAKGGIPAGMFFFLGSVALLCAAGDLRFLLRGGAFGVSRIARHLWRMCFAFFMATGSFFLGQQQVFPAWLRASNVLAVPAILPLILLIYWMFRIRFTQGTRRGIANVA